jgi:hypothetical protein
MRLFRRAWIVQLVFASFLLVGCGGHDDTSEVAAEIRELVAAKPPFSVKAKVWPDVREFYSRRENVPAWIAKDEPARAQAALHIVQNAHEHGLEPSDYGEQGIERLLAMETSGEGRDKDDLDRSGGTPVDPSSVDWDDPVDVYRYDAKQTAAEVEL